MAQRTWICGKCEEFQVKTYVRNWSEKKGRYLRLTLAEKSHNKKAFARLKRHKKTCVPPTRF